VSYATPQERRRQKAAERRGEFTGGWAATPVGTAVAGCLDVTEKEATDDPPR
jgi:hypothetical protein